MKKYISVILVFCISLCAVSVFADNVFPHPGAQTPEVCIDIPITGIYAGDEVYIEAKLSRKLNLYAFETKYSYDADALRFKEIIPTGILAEKTKEAAGKPTDGKGHYMITCVGTPAIQSSDDLFEMSFIAKKSGKTTVRFDGLTLVYPDLEYDRIEEELFANITVKSKSSGNTGGSGGGGGGGGSHGGSIQINIPPAPTDSPKPTETPAPTEKPLPDFTDIGEFAWAEDSIKYLAEKNILSGYEDGSFRPHNYLSRAEFAKIISHMLSLTEPADDTCEFLDVKSEAWYASYVKKTAASKIFNGYEDKTFRPESNITREEFAAILGRAAEFQNLSLPSKRSDTGFYDEQNISRYAASYIEALYAAGIINGDENGLFRPQDFLTRAEAASGIYRFITVTE